MKNAIQILLLLTLTICNPAFADKLTDDSPEVKQLKAMGYDIDQEDDLYTVAKDGETHIQLEKNKDRLLVGRFFTRKSGLTEAQEYELFKIINKINVDSAFQVSVTDTQVNFVQYIYGSYDPKIFAKIIRWSLEVNSYFNDKEFLSLLVD